MKLLEALEIVRAPHRPEHKPFAICLVCGFNPLHFQTFLSAEVCLRMRRAAKIHAGLYGDFWGNINDALKTESDIIVIPLEWPDLDPRVGIRGLGGWSPSVLPEIVATARRRGEQLAGAVRNLAKSCRVVISFPTLSLPPAAFTPGWRASTLEVELKSIVAGLAAELARSDTVRVVSQFRLGELSPLAERADVRSELATGFPYQLKHASILAELFCRSFADQTPKKGLITDLDETLWRGILGDDGVDGVSWDLDHHSHMHGIYQQFLRSLSESGTLVGIASKNDPALVAEAFRRSDILLPRECIFPLEVHWGLKSESVARILKAWNIGAGDVVFVDDSPTELAEVQSAHPGIEVIGFPTQQPQEILQLCWRLRDLFGKDSIAEEDMLRLPSLRQSFELEDEKVNLTHSSDLFLQQAEAELELKYTNEPVDARILELLNKTNQFNLNGQRYTSAELQRYALSEKAFFLVASYRDRYGPLGKIAVITGRQQDHLLLLDNWVMSCRAFGRRIEYACLDAIYNRYGANEIEFGFVATDRNGPLKTFLQEILGVPPASGCRLSRDQFKDRRLETYHSVIE